ncbi:dolichyl-diphosphooligosaccharide--protein glycosyltransferase subunit 1 [Cylas formicarius]|uniref:dolichyl-diphosphooligosaccharide--protein glycosyltransferase subunit 1 n=1 Tax=Cylas formicarius TaxID=197179 RepID=UPI0029588629|nr:dolichyl-diphosphooligosaccharide--protein glycosyltransferase subunit 1 [Cylas formicarius]XP_060517367.1 dolichyl-diphosphooligosaccharide--protein glycosyltransferase subunit 1 [Cylas formicarius]
MFKFLLYVLFISNAYCLQKINEALNNKNVERTIDLTSQLVKITATVNVENTGKELARSYLIALEPELNGNISFVGAKDFSKNDLRVNPIQIEGRSKDIFYNVQFRQPVESGRTVTITIEVVLIKALVPYPSSITQKEKQLVRYYGNHYFYSPYTTQKQKTEVEIYSRVIENYTKFKPVNQVDSKINYGPYDKVAPFSKDEMIIHYENNAPFLTVTRIERVVEISHWGNIAIEEAIEICHTGAKLKGPFSRYDYQRDTGSNHHSIKSYKTILPSGAHSIYYRDMNGNISTSAVKVQKDWIELELRPRFPLFGGWQSSYVLGYSIPSYQYLFKKSTGEYLLNVKVLDHIFDDMYVEELETKIVLPVGVSNIKVKLPYDMQRLSDGVTYKYLDNIGRTVIRVAKNNLVEQHIQDIEITYNWQPHLLLHEPLLVSLALFILFIIVIIYVRLDFSISKPEHVKKE